VANPYGLSLSISSGIWSAREFSAESKGVNMGKRSRDYSPSQEELRWDFDREHGLLDAGEDEYLEKTGYGNAEEAMKAIKAGKPKPKKTEIDVLKAEILKLKERVRKLEATIKSQAEMDEDDRDVERIRGMGYTYR
jgi:hypothetical protein